MSDPPPPPLYMKVFNPLRYTYWYIDLDNSMNNHPSPAPFLTFLQSITFFPLVTAHQLIYPQLYIQHLMISIPLLRVIRLPR